ncbi:glutathione S-transferase N-terminal domain-containing protein [Novosphingobium rosa]|uniref:glutathione S-transferase N-terminal domain-containing protein n=1 Tax=Novosphingobium rosa TaxID=76978 RepID=UPI000834DD60|nr:glutathione S-transferase N-terminal domain-containing protein [Novosphingobium rosa]
MTTTPFRPVLYLKDRCPWCLKLRLFLLEAGMIGRFELRVFVPGDDLEAAMRAELEPHVEKVTFPIAQIAPGQYLTDSGAIIDHYAQEAGVDVASLTTLDQYVRGPLATMAALRKEIAELKGKG